MGAASARTRRESRSTAISSRRRRRFEGRRLAGRRRGRHRRGRTAAAPTSRSAAPTLPTWARASASLARRRAASTPRRSGCVDGGRHVCRRPHGSVRSRRRRARAGWPHERALDFAADVDANASVPLGGAILIGDASVCQPSHGGLCGGNGSAALLLTRRDASSYGPRGRPRTPTPRSSILPARERSQVHRRRRGAGFELAYGPALDDAANVGTGAVGRGGAAGVAVRFEEWPEAKLRVILSMASPCTSPRRRGGGSAASTTRRRSNGLRGRRPCVWIGPRRLPAQLPSGPVGARRLVVPPCRRRVRRLPRQLRAAVGAGGPRRRRRNARRRRRPALNGQQFTDDGEPFTSTPSPWCRGSSPHTVRPPGSRA